MKKKQYNLTHKAFTNKVLLITGGTGSFGTKMVNKFIDSNIKEIRILSRDEKKQNDMRLKYRNPKLKFFIGDVRDYNSIDDCINGSDFIFHAAALKQVPSCEFYPLECFKTNVQGTENVLNSAIKNSVKKVICLSTDKAVYPINAMGLSKAMMEKIAISKSRHTTNTKICITRYGNVIGSRGSVIPLFINQIKNNSPLTITDAKMTRFMMSLDEALDLVLYAFKNGENGDLFVQKSPSADLATIAKSLFSILKTKESKIKEIGTRHGEKLFEVLLSREEMTSAKDLGNYYLVKPDKRDLNYESFYEHGNKKLSKATEYTSHNTKRLTAEELNKILVDLNFHKFY